MISIYPGELKLVVVRHGESEGNVDVNVYKEKFNNNIELTSRGREQAKKLGIAIAEDIHQTVWRDLGDISTVLCPPRLEQALFLSSPYNRTIETAAIVGKELFPHFSGDIRQELLISEISWGDAEGCDSMEEYVQKAKRPDAFYPRLHQEDDLRNTLGHLRYKPSRGETRLEVYTRAGLLLEKFRWFQGHRLVIISGHKEFGIMLHAYLTGILPNDDRPYWPNGTGRVYTLNPRKHEAEWVDEIPHIPDMKKATNELSAILCNHANETPAVCTCPDDCYCKEHTCKGR